MHLCTRTRAHMQVFVFCVPVPHTHKQVVEILSVGLRLHAPSHMQTELDRSPIGAFQLQNGSIFACMPHGPHGCELPPYSSLVPEHTTYLVSQNQNSQTHEAGKRAPNPQPFPTVNLPFPFQLQCPDFLYEVWSNLNHPTSNYQRQAGRLSVATGIHCSRTILPLIALRLGPHLQKPGCRVAKRLDRIQPPNHYTPIK